MPNNRFCGESSERALHPCKLWHFNLVKVLFHQPRYVYRGRGDQSSLQSHLATRWGTLQECFSNPHKYTTCNSYCQSTLINNSLGISSSTFGSQIAVTLMTFSPALPISRVGLVAIFQVFYQNIMVSHVYWMTRLHSNNMLDDIPTHITSIRFDHDISTSRGASGDIPQPLKTLQGPCIGPIIERCSDRTSTEEYH